MNDVVEDEYENHRTKPEDVAVHLNCFLQHAFSLFVLQQPDGTKYFSGVNTASVINVDSGYILD